MAQDLPRRMAHLVDGLRRAGIRMTHQRLEVCRQLAGATDHPDAEAVYLGVRERVSTISLDTVYRTLWLLRDLGLIDALTISGPRMRFDGNPAPHHHFLCSACGEAYDFYREEFDQLPVPREVRARGTVQKIQVEMRGTCLRCARAKHPARGGAARRRSARRD
jgi:Fur family transcriptional regulator, peroxide stress response regulator